MRALSSHGSRSSRSSRVIDKIGTLPGANHDAVNRAKRAGIRGRAFRHRERVAAAFDLFDSEAQRELQPPAVHEFPQIVAELAARFQLVGFTTTEHAGEIGSAHRPDDLQPVVRFREPRQIKQHVGGRMPAADHEHATARIGVPIAPENIGHAIGDPIGEGDFADCRRAGRRCGILVASTFPTRR